jgi:hypothetical protein
VAQAFPQSSSKQTRNWQMTRSALPPCSIGIARLNLTIR